MAFDAFLKLEGVKGESMDKVHKGEVDLLSFSLGASNPTSSQGTGGLGAGKVSISSFNIMKKMDAASPGLFSACCQGKHFPKATVTLRKAGGAAPLEYLVYNFEKVFVESIQWSGSTGGDDVPTESVSLTFGKIEITYKTQDAKGGSKDTLGAKWDIEANTGK
jgi:type VI secretion system secreted protein Hcp